MCENTLIDLKQSRKKNLSAQYTSAVKNQLLPEKHANDKSEDEVVDHQVDGNGEESPVYVVDL